MEVFSFFSNESSLMNNFELFINEYPLFSFRAKDADTIFYKNKVDGKSEIYFHFLYCDVDDVLFYNYNSLEIKIIKNYFKNQKIFLFDIQYRVGNLFNQFLNDLEEFFKIQYKHNDTIKILACHPFIGLIEFDKYLGFVKGVNGKISG